jgi:hypothetical protein
MGQRAVNVHAFVLTLRKVISVAASSPALLQKRRRVPIGKVF